MQPAESFLSPSWGAYRLAAALNVPAPLPVPASTPGLPSDAPPAPSVTIPPQYPTRFTVAPVQFPQKPAPSASLRPSFGRRESLADASSVAALASLPIPMPGLRENEETVVGSLTSGASSGSPQFLSSSVSGAFLRPLPKRKQSSSFSIATLASSLGNGDEGGLAVRPIRQFRGTSSSFVRSWEGLPLSQYQLKSLLETNAGKETLFAFYTHGKSVVWVEIGEDKGKDALCRVGFSDYPTCVDVSRVTAAPDRLDVLIGFGGSGDIMWFDPLLAKYTRFNKAGIICPSAVTSIRWLPNQLFVSSHADGSVVIWSPDKDDATFVPSSVPRTPLMSEGVPSKGGDIVVTRPPTLDAKGALNRFNPVTFWNVTDKAVTAFAFSHDLLHCAVVGADGLRIIDTVTEQLLDTFAGYFGALTCVAWCPTGRFVLVGGQDDLVTVYSLATGAVMARCQGHTSFVQGVAFQPPGLDDRTTRFASVGEDCKLVLWDFSQAALSRPKLHGPYSRDSSNSLPLARRRTTGESLAHLPLAVSDRSRPVYHPAPKHSATSMLQPTKIAILSDDPFSDLIILPAAPGSSRTRLITLSRTGQLRLFEQEDGMTSLGGPNL